MEEKVAILSMGEKGKVRLDYSEGNGGRVALWEPFDNGVLETLFDTKGGILKQSLMEIKDKKEDVAAAGVGLIVERTSSRITNGKYSEISIDKKCPSCNKSDLSRIASTVNDSSKIPVMPMYECRSCGSQSYYLTDEYLEYLVTNNRDLFSENEAKELASQRGATLNELREYIIRIFACKRINNIR
ncbi:MAG: hypothetical protein M1504_01555 [Candidatus Marsarchaeota archaeon]|nr:hypothetical protein [Candidatus Marsarchaeota archaeon]